MRKVFLFVEDFGQQEVFRALLQKYIQEYRLSIDIQIRSASGGHGSMQERLKTFIRDLQRNQDELPDLLIIGRDANCKGFTARRGELEACLHGYSGAVCYAIPDPHIERWLLIDSAAFKTVLGRGCKAPDYKCIRDRYKELLLDAVREAEEEPSFGGMEYAADIIEAMDLLRCEQLDESLGRFIKELRAAFQQWSDEDRSALPSE